MYPEISRFPKEEKVDRRREREGETNREGEENKRIPSLLGNHPIQHNSMSMFNDLLHKDGCLLNMFTTYRN